MRLKRWLYGLPLMSGYRGMRTRALAANHRAHPLGFKFAGYDQFFGEWEPKERAVVEDVMGKVDVMIDVGANIGFYTCWGASNGKIVAAVEPEPGNVNFLLSNVAANEFDVEVYPIAMSDGPGVVKIYGDADTASVVPGWCGMDSSFVQMVPSNSLDNLFADRWSGQRKFIKIDVEGFERAVLDGAWRLVRQEPRPTWLIECFPHHFTAGRPRNDFFLPLFERMFHNGYKATSVDTREELTIDHVRRMSERSPLTINEAHFNFLFQSAD